VPITEAPLDGAAPAPAAASVSGTGFRMPKPVGSGTTPLHSPRPSPSGALLRGCRRSDAGSGPPRPPFVALGSMDCFAASAAKFPPSLSCSSTRSASSCDSTTMMRKQTRSVSRCCCGGAAARQRKAATRPRRRYRVKRTMRSPLLYWTGRLRASISAPVAPSPGWLAFAAIGAALAVPVDDPLAALGVQSGAAPPEHHALFTDVAKERGTSFIHLYGVTHNTV